jgi:hypothetical protein
MARRKIMGSDSGSSGGGGGSDDDKKSSSSGSGKTVASVQAQINAALDASGGAWTSELNDLVAERDSLSGGGDKGTAEYNMFGDKISEGGATDTQLATQSQYANEKVGGGTSGTETSVTPVQTVSVQTDDDDPVYYDAFGGSHSSFASASAADQQYIAQEQAAQAQIATQQQAAAEAAAAAEEQQKEMSFFNNLFGSPAAAATPPGEQIPSGISGDDPYEMEYYPEQQQSFEETLFPGSGFGLDDLADVGKGFYNYGGRLISDFPSAIGDAVSGIAGFSDFVGGASPYANLSEDQRLALQMSGGPLSALYSVVEPFAMSNEKLQARLAKNALERNLGGGPKGFAAPEYSSSFSDSVSGLADKLYGATDSLRDAIFTKEELANQLGTNIKGKMPSDVNLSGTGKVSDVLGNIGGEQGDVLTDYAAMASAPLGMAKNLFEGFTGTEKQAGSTIDSLIESGALSNNPKYQEVLAQVGGNEKAAAQVIKNLAVSDSAIQNSALNLLDAVPFLNKASGFLKSQAQRAGLEFGQEPLQDAVVTNAINKYFGDDVAGDPFADFTGKGIQSALSTLAPGGGRAGTQTGEATTVTPPATDSEAETVQEGELVPNIQVGDVPTLIDPSVIQNPNVDQANLLTQRPVPYNPGGGPIVVSPTAGELASSPIGIQSAYEQAALGAPNLEIEQTAPTLNEVKAAQDIIDEMLSSNNNVVDFKTLQGIQEQTNLSMEQLADMTGQTIAANEQMGTDPANLNQPPVDINTALSDSLLTPPNIETQVGIPDPSMTMPNLQDFDMSLLDPSGPTQADPEGILSLATQTGEQPKMEGVSPLTVVQPSDQEIDPFVYEGEILGGEPSTETVTPSKGPIDFEDAEFVDVGTDLEVVTPKTTEVVTTTDTDTDKDDDTTISIPITTDIDPDIETETDPDTDTQILVETTVEDDDEDQPDLMDTEEPGGGESDDPQMNVVTVGDDEDDDEAPFTCPDGYEAVKQDGIWVCEKIAKKSKARKGRPTIGTRPYVTRPGFAKRTKTYESA